MPTFDVELDYDTAERLVVAFLTEMYESLDKYDDDDPGGYVREAIDLLMERLMSPIELRDWRM